MSVTMIIILVCTGINVLCLGGILYLMWDMNRK